MATNPFPDEKSHPHADSSTDYQSDDTIDLRDLIARLWRGIYQIVGLMLLGLFFALLGYLIYSPFQKVTTSTRVVFAFPGFERGEYPDKSRFQPDDLRAPDVVAEALKRRNLDSSPEFQSTVRAALSIEGIVPPNIIRDRDRQRAAGQSPVAYLPDEYVVSFSVPRTFPLSPTQRQQLLIEIINVYRENFRRTYADMPLGFGSAFAVLHNADFPDYETIFDREMRSITEYLLLQVEAAKLYRSPTTNLSFSDLLRQSQLFAQIRLNETLGLIHQNGLSRNRKIALVKMNDALRLLTDDERRALDEEMVVRDLLTKAQSREQNYVLGVKSQASQSRTGAPIIDQGMIDSLLANDSYGFLVRKALDAGLKVKQVQANKSVLLAQIENMKAFSRETVGDQSAIIADVEKSVAVLEASYQELMNAIRKTHADFARQRFGDAVRVTNQVLTVGIGIRPLAMPAFVGALLGFAAGAGLSLLGFYIGRSKRLA